MSTRLIKSENLPIAAWADLVRADRTLAEDVTLALSDDYAQSIMGYALLGQRLGKKLAEHL
jgi:hypothetical protein